MTNEMAIDMAKSKLKCLEMETSGSCSCDDAISHVGRLIDLANAIESDDSGYWTNKRISSALRNISSVTQKCEKCAMNGSGSKYCDNCGPKSGKWIPVSERLPEAFRFVNCTCHSLIDDREDWVVETCYLPQLPDSPYSDWGNIPMLNMGDCEVVAWMYRDIPKPYKVEPQESEKALDTEGVLDKIKAEIESNMESIIGKYDSSIPKSNMPSYKIERNKVRKECISIIDKYR